MKIVGDTENGFPDEELRRLKKYIESLPKGSKIELLIRELHEAEGQQS